MSSQPPKRSFMLLLGQNSLMCIRIYIFNLKEKQKENKTKQDDKKSKRKKENICGKSNRIRWYLLQICSVY